MGCLERRYFILSHYWRHLEPWWMPFYLPHARRSLWNLMCDMSPREGPEGWEKKRNETAWTAVSLFLHQVCKMLIKACFWIKTSIYAACLQHAVPVVCRSERRLSWTDIRRQRSYPRWNLWGSLCIIAHHRVNLPKRRNASTSWPACAADDEEFRFVVIDLITSE